MTILTGLFMSFDSRAGESGTPAEKEGNAVLSEEFFEFFMEYEATDEETFDLIVFHGQQDAQKDLAESSDEAREGSAIADEIR